MLEHRLATEPDSSVSHPMKRKVDDGEWSYPPSQRLALDPELHSSTSAQDQEEYSCPDVSTSEIPPPRVPEMEASLRQGDLQRLSIADLVSIYW